MKISLLTILFLATLACFGQNEKPYGTSPVPSYSVSYRDADSTTHIYKGSTKKWNELYSYWSLSSDTSNYVPGYVNYGYLYNWQSLSNIAASNAHVPSFTEWTALSDYLGGYTVSGGKLKETGYTHWTTPNTGATNEVGFNAVGSGYRLANGDFSLIQLLAYYFSSTITSTTMGTLYLSYDNIYTSFQPFLSKLNFGYSVRLIIDTPNVDNGDGTGEYWGNDGRKYAIKQINSVWWLTSNLAETKYNNGTYIPEVTDNSAWAALTTGARCSYNNDNNSIVPPSGDPGNTLRINTRNKLKFKNNSSLIWEKQKTNDSTYQIEATVQNIGIKGIGVKNNIPRWNTSADSLVQSNAYADSSNMSIGTDTLSRVLDIKGVDSYPVRLRGNEGGGLILGQLPGYSWWGGIWPISVTPTYGNFGLITSNYGTEIGHGDNGYVHLLADGIQKLAVNHNGGVSIGDTTYTEPSHDPGAGKLIVQNSIGAGLRTPLAKLHLGAGSTTANTAPLKFTSGPLTTIAEPGTIEYYLAGFHIRGTDSLTVPRLIDEDLTSGRVTFSSGGGRLTDHANLLFSPITGMLTNQYSSTNYARLTSISSGSNLRIQESSSVYATMQAASSGSSASLNFTNSTYSINTGMYSNANGSIFSAYSNNSSSGDGWLFKFGVISDYPAIYASDILNSLTDIPIFKIKPNLYFYDVGLGDSDGITAGLGVNTDIYSGGVMCIRSTENGNVGIGVIAPTAVLHLKAGTTLSGTAPLKIASGPLMTTAENDAIENDGSHLYYTSGGTRLQLDNAGGGGGGTVTSIATSGAIIGGTITTSGTITHHSGDGYHHIPATGTTNNGKVLYSGATAGSEYWRQISNDSVQVISTSIKTWDVLRGVNATLSQTDTITISIQNLRAGMTGNLTLTNPSTAKYLKFKGYTNKISPAIYVASNEVSTSGGSKIDVFSWYYDGTRVLWNGTKDYK